MTLRGVKDGRTRARHSRQPQRLAGAAPSAGFQGRPQGRAQVPLAASCWGKRGEGTEPLSPSMEVIGAAEGVGAADRKAPTF